MFGYIVVNKPELKIKDFEVYHSYYCGLCRALKTDYGVRGQLTLNYDMTFLVILLTGLYEPETVEGAYRCALHPFMRQTARSNVFTKYAAAMNVILAYYKCEDDWQDERRIDKKAFSKLLQGSLKGMGAAEQEKRERIAWLLREISRCEKQGVADIDRMTTLSGEMLGEVFAYRQDGWEEELRVIGFYLGKFIYLCDAYEDVEEDIRKGSYNLLKDRAADKDFDRACGEMLKMMIAQCCREFEKLPIILHVDILRNILYSGVWSRYERTREKRLKNSKEKEKNEDGG